MIQAKFRGKKERADPAAEANVRRARSKNDPQLQAGAYMKTHKLMVRRRRRTRVRPTAPAGVRPTRALAKPGRGDRSCDPPARQTCVAQASELMTRSRLTLAPRPHLTQELFELLGQRLVREQPEDPKAFLVSYLEEIARTSDKTSPMNFFTDQDISTLFSMYDQQKNGITQAQCREALNAIGLEEVTVPDRPRIDLATFRGLIPNAN